MIMGIPSAYCVQGRARPWMRARWLAALFAGGVIVAPTLAHAQQSAQAQPLQSGYLPGERTALGVGLSPYAPQAPSLPGGLTTPSGAPEPASDDWTFNFRGFMSAA